MRIYAHVIGRVDAQPDGGGDTGEGAGDTGGRWHTSSAGGGPGRYGRRCSPTATGPTPGPPPPCGMQNVLWRFRWLTSPPNRPGRASPISALRFAPSTYT